MTRPLARHGIAQLEELFAASLVDEKILKNLETELRYRQVPRAVSLLAQVQRALYSGPTAALSDAPRIQRHGLTVQKAATSDLATIGSPSGAAVHIPRNGRTAEGGYAAAGSDARFFTTPVCKIARCPSATVIRGCCLSGAQGISQLDLGVH